MPLQVYHMLIADNTAKMNASLFDCYGELLQAGDIVRLTGGYCSLYKARSARPRAATRTHRDRILAAGRTQPCALRRAADNNHISHCARQRAGRGRAGIVTSGA